MATRLINSTVFAVEMEAIQKYEEYLDLLIENFQGLMESMPDGYYRNRLQDEIYRLDFVNSGLKEALDSFH